LKNASTAAGDAGKSSATNAAGIGASQAVQHAAGSGLGGYVAGSAAGAFAQSMVGGMFGKKKKPDAAAAQAPAAQPGAPDAGLTTVAEITMETTAIDIAPISAEQFEVPVSWKKITPNAQVNDALPNCPGG
jgi:hypothetical protein